MPNILETAPALKNKHYETGLLRKTYNPTKTNKNGKNEQKNRLVSLDKILERNLE